MTSSSKKRLKRVLWFLVLALLLGYAAVWKMARHSPGPGDAAWQEMVRAEAWGRTMDYKGAAQYYLEAGAGQPLLLIHGYADSSYTWHKNIKALVEAGFKVVAPDLPGMGQSMRPEGFGFTPREQADFILSLLNRLELEKVDVVGNSLGGSLTLWLAWKHPDRVGKIIPVDPACYLRPRYKFYVQAAETAWPAALIRPLIGPWVYQLGLRRSYHDPDRVTEELVSQKSQAFYRDDYRQNLILLAGGYFGESFVELSGHYDQIKASTLLIWGATDRLINTELFAERLHQDMPGSRLVIIDQAGHLPQQEQAEEFNRLVIDFLNQPTD